MSASRMGRSGRRRASDFAVVRWLSVGAAGVGVGVVAWAGTGVASADSGGSASDAGSTGHTSAAARASAESGRSAAHRQLKAAPLPSAAAVPAGLGVRNSLASKAAASSSPDASEAVSPVSDVVAARASDRPRGVARSAAAVRAVSDESHTAALVGKSLVGDTQDESVPYDETPSDRGWVSDQTPSVKELFDGAIYGVLDGVSNLLSKFPSGPITDFLQGAWLTVRRTFFNQAPTLDPSQTTGQLSGTITGTLGAVDPESDQMMYSVLQNPVQGTVNLNPDGTFTYTPGTDFDGRDVFIVAARDTTEPAFNVLDPFGNGITEALVTVEQGTTPRVNYAFTFKQTTYLLPLRIERWSEEAEIALEWAAINLADQIVPDQDVTLTFTATAQYLRGDNLASANSPLTGTGGGFFPTVVQARIQTGSPSVTKDGAPVPDGIVNVNFFQDWGYFGEVGEDEFNYETTVMHEMLHAYGFLSTVGPAGKNGGQNEPWSVFDEFITNSSGTPAVDTTTYAWKTDFNPNLTGGNGGLYFYGTNEAAAFNGEGVPLYTPAKWMPGSSVTHLNDAYFYNKTDPNDPHYVQLMNANDNPGPSGPDYLSSIEIGILKDIGYTMA